MTRALGRLSRRPKTLHCYNPQIESARLAIVTDVHGACIRAARKNAGAAFSSAVSPAVFGYLVQHFGKYNAPFLPMIRSLCVGAFLSGEPL